MKKIQETHNHYQNIVLIFAYTPLDPE